MDFSNFDEIVKICPWIASTIIRPVPTIYGLDGLFICCGVKEASSRRKGHWIQVRYGSANISFTNPIRHELADGVRILDYDKSGKPLAALDIFWSNE